MFIYTLPILFTTIRYVTPIELMVIFFAALMMLWISSPLATEHCQKPHPSNYLFAGWIGCLGVHWVFWPFFILLNIGLYTTDTLAKVGMLTVSSWDEIHFVLLLTVMWWTTAVWRCSANTQVRFWGAFARLMTLAVFFEYGLKLLIRIDYPRVFFNCEDLFLDYGSCF